MIPRRKSVQPHRRKSAAALREGKSVPAIEPVPGWLRRSASDDKALAIQNLEDVALTAGAAIAALDALVRRRERWAGVWRQRLALSAAAVTVRQAGRIEDEGALRDTVLLARSGDFLSVGPAGRMLLAWRRLATQPAEDLLTEGNLTTVLEDFGYAADGETIGDLAAGLQQLFARSGPTGLLIGAFTAAERHGFGPVVGAWLAEALLARRLGWSHAVPLLGTEAALRVGAVRRRRDVPGASSPDMQADHTKNLLAAQARMALQAIDLFTELGRRAEKLLAVTPKLRAKGADAIIERLLNEDALVASRGMQKSGISDRGLRRLFDRLIELGAVRELTGRPTFRIYGL